MNIKQALLLRSLVAKLKNTGKDSELQEYFYEFSGDITRTKVETLYTPLDNKNTEKPRNRSERRNLTRSRKK